MYIYAPYHYVHKLITHIIYISISMMFCCLQTPPSAPRHVGPLSETAANCHSPSDMITSTSTWPAMGFKNMALEKQMEMIDQ